jgi:hypothetical protein
MCFRHVGRWDRAVSIVTGWRGWFVSCGAACCLSVLPDIGTAVGPIQPPVLWEPACIPSVYLWGSEEVRIIMAGALYPGQGHC